MHTLKVAQGRAGNVTRVAVVGRQSLQRSRRQAPRATPEVDAAVLPCAEERKVRGSQGRAGSVIRAAVVGRQSLQRSRRQAPKARPEVGEAVLMHC